MLLLKGKFSIVKEKVKSASCYFFNSADMKVYLNSFSLRQKQPQRSTVSLLSGLPCRENPSHLNCKASHQLLTFVNLKKTKRPKQKSNSMDFLEFKRIQNGKPLPK